jgi:hypothetical protein
MKRNYEISENNEKTNVFHITVAAGANVLVAGSTIFAAGVGVCAAMQRLRSAINCGAY